ncbi:type II toxin-antitoxin system HipA family toxin YjjJ [Granulosicoccus antarcticus]|uniref:HipA-like C-terminal domain-containing protein n=1 Tax=Granulosicoccus antarcticus IMCC3135 TaxID=1192854 RepID=A0A2Z2P0V8_9GAMM|nr:type II toxin-antitoxin system HipA family toxin YjjJ [Granulosicoccus antarcticus]ASJ75788.1 hypothetical protein IMCC3135_28680 [Granulosicoccus antarcticus IMCC3135]
MAKNALGVAQCLESDILTSKQLQLATGLGQPAVSRQIGSLGDRVVKLPNGRSPKYALTRNAFGSGDKIPLFVVDADGNNTIAAYIRPLLIRGFFVELCPGGSPLLLGVNGSGVFDDLPYYIQGLRPQGFLGRQIVSELAARSTTFPNDPIRWQTSHLGRYLIANGEDLPGNFQFGEAGLVRTRRAPTTYWRDDYPAIADAVLSGELAGSSAGGEQPKFTVYSEEKSSYVIVKFSPAGHEADASRWRDILITEYHATETLHAGSVAAANVKLVEKDDRLFLESERFDRTGHYGRSSMISLQMIDAEFVGDGADWPTVMTRLADKNLISSEHLQHARLLWEFGYLINNTDMHLGNMSLGMLDDKFNLLPSYDMCSMGFAPMRGLIKPLSFSPKGHSRLDCLSGNVPMYEKVRLLAMDFWERVANDDRISGEFRKFLTQGNPIL